MASTETLGTLATLAGLGAIVWRAAKLQASLEKSIESASKTSDDAIRTASLRNDDAIAAATQTTKEGQQKLQERFSRQFEKLQEHNAESYRALNESLQLHLRDFQHERLDRQKSEELINKIIEAFKIQVEKDLSDNRQTIDRLQEEIKDISAFLEKNHQFVIRDR
jgi:flagellar basal body-associated protein FliL